MAAEALFSRIADDLRRQIVTGELAPGERLPTEHDLAARYSTTRATVRKALAVLRSEGRIDSSQGSGSYIKRRAPILMQSTGAVWRSRRRSGAPNFNAEMTARGLEARQELLRVDTITAAPEIAAQLGLDEDAEMIVRRLMFTVEGEPVQRTDGYYPASMFAATPISEARRVRGGVAAYIEDEMGRRISQFVERLSMRMPLPEEIAMLKLGPGVPVVNVQRLARDTEGVPVEFLDSVVVGDRYIFEYVIDVDASEDGPTSS